MPAPRSLGRSLGLWALLIAASGILAYGLALARFPAALLLGPMLAAIAFGVRGAGITLPKAPFQAAQALIGCLVAHAVNAEITGTLLDDGFLILLVVLVTVAAGAVVGVILTRMRVLPGTTAAWGSSPGGAAAMVAMAEEYGSDPRLVAFMQYVRVAAVVLSASLVARLLTDAELPAGAAQAASPAAPLGAVLATLAVAAVGAGVALALRLPAGALVGPMLLGSALHATGLASISLPPWLLNGAYAVIGWYVGLRFTRETLAETLHAFPGIAVATLAVIALCAAWAFGLTRILPIDFLTAFLATSPGGLDSVAIIAVGSKADVSFVLAVQTLRLFVVLVTGPILAKWIARAAPPDPAPRG
ncbi:membrane AbrB-like protein [Methylobacterium sp. BE186]|uniref:AbrB family transcriptional regulator n=1 Tax=Methylobacterium sp. BE186 TaxID=2817715 RepID=UPI00285EDC35|nr:AbrB family transcriptional regulator [Methylobacterium sp. BE186]MDR7036826.1 membrane AbrB-like protein [Methylobacterium sp. BE186]